MLPPDRGRIAPSRRRAAHARLAACVSAALVVTPAAGTSQQDTTRGERDTLRVHELSEVTVVAPAAGGPAASFTLIRIPTREIAERDAMSAADVARLVPAAHVQTNSRGETLLYLRDAGERQVGIFFDGALLNIPWDNRIDLSLVPASAIGGITVAKGVPPVEYGTNVLGGAVNLTSRTPGGDGAAQAAAAGGTAARRQGSASRLDRAGRFSYQGVVAHSAIDAQPLAGGANLPYNQSNATRRTNTDARITNVFARGAYRLDAASQLGVSLLVVDAEKGVAPEGHLDPTVSRVRFWRYPRWRNVAAILSGDGILGGHTAWKGAAWVNHFRQHIVSYGSVTYDDPEAREEDRDLTFGARGVLQGDVGVHSFKLAANALTSTHRQRDVDLGGGGAGPLLGYRQHLLSGGAEYEVRPARGLVISVGAGIDAMLAPLTGDKPAIDPFVDYAATSGVRYRLGGGWFVRASAGRKTRFPTMRELFGESLDRFLVNPDLEPESSWLAEVAAGVHGARASGELIPFAAFTTNTIAQRNVLLPGETRPRRQRVNLPGSRVLGVELVAAAEPLPRVDVETHLTLMRPRRRQEAPDDPEFLEEKPEILARGSVGYTAAQGLGALVEGVYTGRAYSLDEADTLVPLPTSFVLNLRLSQRFTLDGGVAIELFGRGDNITDELVVPQLGLPAPGRAFTAGMTVDF